MSNFADRMFEAVRKKKSPLDVGLDPRVGQIPDHIKRQAMEMHEDDMLAATAEALYLFNVPIIDAAAGLIPAVKPNIAFYEKYGPAGYDAYRRTVEHSSDAGLVVLGDVKRGDIGSTSGSYAEGFLGQVELVDGSKAMIFDDKIDAITINALFGTDSTQPFLNYCDAKHGKGAILLCKTSNKSAGETQDVVLRKENITFCEMMADLISGWGSDYIGSCGYSSVGAVVGATSDMQEALRKRMGKIWFLVPGYGAQGAKAEDITPSFGPDGSGAVVNSARGIILAYTKAPYNEKYGPEQYADAARQAVIDSNKELVGALKACGKGGIFS